MSYMEKYYIEDEKHRQKILKEIDEEIKDKKLEAVVFSTLAGGWRHSREVAEEVSRLMKKREIIESYPLWKDRELRVETTPFNPEKVSWKQPNISIQIGDLRPCESFVAEVVSGSVVAVGIYKEKYYLCISKKHHQFELHDKRTLDYQVLAKREGWE